MVFEYIDPLVFIISFGVGMLFTYIYSPPPKVVIKYPNPYNASSTMYQDDNGVCYKYRPVKVDCPALKSETVSFVN